jgi:putative protease
MQKTRKKKPTPRKAAKKKAKKKALKKTTVAGKKTAVKKKALKKKTLKKTVKKKAVRRTKPARGREIPPKPLMVEPGPPPGSIPPVEEPTSREEAIGVVTHYYSHLGVAVVQINKGTLSTAETVHFTGHSTDFTQQVESMEYEHRHVDQASAGQSVGIRVKDHTREHDIVYRVK